MTVIVGGWGLRLFKELILEKSEIRVNLELNMLFTHFGVTTRDHSGIQRVGLTPK